LDRKVNPTAVQRAFQRDGQGCLPLADSGGLGGRAVIPELDYPDVSANSVVMAALGGGHPEKHKVFQAVTGWPGQAWSSPAMNVERKFANVFMASSASGNIRVIKSRKGEALIQDRNKLKFLPFCDPGSGPVGRDDECGRAAGMTIRWPDQWRS